MNILLDTHALIWFINGSDDELSRDAIVAIKDLKNTCYMSIASVWERGIKYSIGKLHLQSGFDHILEFLKANSIEILTLTFSHIQQLTKLPLPHRDPFDRIIIAQGIEEKLVIVTRDENFKKYPVQQKW